MQAWRLRPGRVLPVAGWMSPMQSTEQSSKQARVERGRRSDLPRSRRAIERAHIVDSGSCRKLCSTAMLANRSYTLTATAESAAKKRRRPQQLARRGSSRLAPCPSPAALPSRCSCTAAELPSCSSGEWPRPQHEHPPARPASVVLRPRPLVSRARHVDIAFREDDLVEAHGRQASLLKLLPSTSTREPCPSLPRPSPAPWTRSRSRARRRPTAPRPPPPSRSSTASSRSSRSSRVAPSTSSSARSLRLHSATGSRPTFASRRFSPCPRRRATPSSVTWPSSVRPLSLSRRRLRLLETGSLTPSSLFLLFLPPPCAPSPFSVDLPLCLSDPRSVSLRGVVFFQDQHDIVPEDIGRLALRLGELAGKPEDSTLHIHPTQELSESGLPLGKISSTPDKEGRQISFAEKGFTSSGWHTDVGASCSLSLSP